MDNIADPTSSEIVDSELLTSGAQTVNEQNAAEAAATEKPREQVVEFFTTQQAADAIATFYKRSFPSLQARAPMQIVDGCVIEFLENDVVMATARMRMRNHLHLLPHPSHMVLEVALSDLSFSKPSVTIDAKYDENATAK